MEDFNVTGDLFLEVWREKETLNILTDEQIEQLYELAESLRHIPMITILDQEKKRRSLAENANDSKNLED